MKYRAHRGDLAASIKTTVEVHTFDELVAAINKGLSLDVLCPNHLIQPDQISFREIGPDDRCGWARTFVVNVQGAGAVGYTDALIEKPS
jgi:hypothetical protein